MENTNQTVEDAKVEETGAVTQTETQNEGSAEVEMIPKEKADEMVKMALKKQLPSKEDMKAFKEWKESQKTEAEKQAEKLEQDNATKQELSEAKKEIAVYKAGVTDPDDVEFLMFKVSKMEGDFSDNLGEFLKQNPKYTTKEVVQPKTDGVATQKGNFTKEDGVMTILKSKHPDLYN